MSKIENPKYFLEKTLVLEDCDENALIYIFMLFFCDDTKIIYFAENNLKNIVKEIYGNRGNTKLREKRKNIYMSYM